MSRAGGDQNALRFDGPVTLAGGGPLAPADLVAALKLAPAMVAADAGADAVLARGHTPLAVIGDMDSISSAGRSVLPDHRVHEVTEQTSTDFEKCLSRIDAPLVLALGFAGGRVDHVLAVFNVLARHPARRCVVIGASDVCVLAPPRLLLPLAAGTRVSLFPMAPATGESEGLRWPIDGIDFAPAGPIGTSNCAEGPVGLRFSAPGMLLILPRDCLPELLAALDEAPRW